MSSPTTSATITSARHCSRSRNSPTSSAPAPRRCRARRCCAPISALAAGWSRPPTAYVTRCCSTPGPEGAIFVRNCANLGIALGEIECIAVSHGHWDHMAALPAALDAIREQGGKATVHVNPGMFNERAIRLSSGTVVPAAKVPSPAEMEALGADGRQRPGGTVAARRAFLFERRNPAASAPLKRAGSITSAAPAPRRRGSPIRC